MKHMFFEKALYLLLFYIKYGHSGSIKNKYGNIDVDDFLKKVMVSEKFDELIEKIADKAVDKFQRLQHDDKHISGPNSKDTVYRVSEAKDPNETSEEEATMEPSNISDENEKIDIIQGIKIDTAAFKKKEPELLKEFGLKYNQFTKSIYRQTPNDKTDATDSEDFFANKLKAKSSVEAGIHKMKAQEFSKHFGTADSAEVVPKTLVKGKKTHADFESGISEEATPKNLNVRKKDLEQSENTDMTKENTKFNEHKDRAGDESKEFFGDLNSDSLEIKKKDTIENYVAKDDQIQNDTNKHHTYEYLTLPVPEKENNRLRPGFDSIEANKKSKKSEEKSSENEKLEGDIEVEKVLVRKEGNVLYTHEKNPDYEDYDKEIARIQRELKQNKRKANNKNVNVHD